MIETYIYETLFLTYIYETLFLKQIKNKTYEYIPKNRKSL